MKIAFLRFSVVIIFGIFTTGCQSVMDSTPPQGRPPTEKEQKFLRAAGFPTAADIAGTLVKRGEESYPWLDSQPDDVILSGPRPGKRFRATAAEGKPVRYRISDAWLQGKPGAFNAWALYESRVHWTSPSGQGVLLRHDAANQSFLKNPDGRVISGVMVFIAVSAGTPTHTASWQRNGKYYFTPLDANLRISGPAQPDPSR